MFSILLRNKNYDKKSYSYLLNPEFKKYLINSHLTSINNKLINNKLIEYKKDAYNKNLINIINNSLHSNLNNELSLLLFTFYSSLGIFIFYEYFKQNSYF
jgi:hypothetical protein